MLPFVLARTAHDEEIAVADIEGAAAASRRGAARFRSNPEGAGGTHADDGDRRVHHGLGEPVAVPGNRVVALAVPVVSDRVEHAAVMLAQRASGVIQDWERFSIPTGSLAPPRCEPRFREPAFVHRHDPLPPGHGGGQLVEHRVGAAQPSPGDIDPAPLVEGNPVHVGERGIDRRGDVPEQ